MVNAIIEESTDMAMCPWIRFDKNGCIDDAQSSARTVLNTDKIASTYLAAYKRSSKYGSILMNKLFILERIFEIYFGEDLKIGEDIEYFINIMPSIRSCVTVPTTYYQYRLRNSSLTKSCKMSQSVSIYKRFFQTTEKHGRLSSVAQSLIYGKLVNSLYEEIRDDIYYNKPIRYN